MNSYEPLGERQPAPKLAIALIMLLFISIVIALVFLIGSNPPDSSTQAGTTKYTIATQVLSADEDIVIGINNVTLYMPRDATDVAGSIAIFPREPNLFSTSGDTRWIRPLVVNVEFRDEQGKPVSPIVLAKPTEICFKITEERWQDYTRHPNEYEVQTYADEKNPPRWEPLTLVPHPERSQLCGQIDHFSLFALATKPETKIPITGVNSTPTPGPKTLIDILGDFLGQGSGKSSGDQSGDLYEP
jgi:hypothetical protein